MSSCPRCTHAGLQETTLVLLLTYLLQLYVVMRATIPSGQLQVCGDSALGSPGLGELGLNKLQSD